MTTGLERITAKAQSDGKLTFTSLAHHLTPALLFGSLSRIPANSGSGVDGMDVKAARDTFEQWSGDTLGAVHRGGYRPPPVKRVYIPKPGKQEKRPIGVPTIQDRCLQGAVANVLSAIYEQDFLDCSMGGRPGRGAHNAVATLHEVIGTRKVGWVYEADLKNFFGSLDHGWVERFMSERVGDPRILTLIKRWLKAGVMEDEQWLETTEGVPQGGPISVLISNVYLHYALDLWVEKVVKPRLKGEVYYIRYVDDFILGFQYREDARRFERVLSKRLEKFSLSLEPSKTRLVRFGRFASEGARQHGEKLQTLYFLGFTFYCDRNRRGSFKVGVKTEKSRLKRSFNKLKLKLRGNRHLPLQYQISQLNAFLIGHYNYYGITGNYGALKNVYYAAIKFWRKALSSRSQSGRMNWEKYRKILKHYPIREPKIRLTYGRLKALALL